jgi:hypothetical protein
LTLAQAEQKAGIHRVNRQLWLPAGAAEAAARKRGRFGKKFAAEHGEALRK